MSYSHPGPPRTLPRRAPLKKVLTLIGEKKKLGRADSAPLQEAEDGELLGAAARAGVEVAQHIAKFCWLVVDQMGVERTVKLSIVVAGQTMRKMDRSSVVLGEDLSTRDGKVKVSAKKNSCSRTDQKSCKKSCERTDMAKCFATTLLFSNILLYKMYDHVIDISKRPTDRKFS